MPLPPTTLPIVRRGSRLLPPDAAEEGPGLPAARRAAAGLLSGGSSEATSDAGDERSVTVKNTFLDVSSSEDLAESPRLAQTWSVGAWTAQVCSARPEPRGPRAEEAAPCLFESTPWGDSPAARAASLLPQEPAREVLLQVPLRLCPGHPLAGGALGGLEVEVRHEGGQTVVTLRLGAGRPGDVALASPPSVASAAPSAASSQASSPTPSERGAAAPRARARGPPGRRAGWSAATGRTRVGAGTRTPASSSTRRTSRARVSPRMRPRRWPSSMRSSGGTRPAQRRRSAPARRRGAWAPRPSSRVSGRRPRRRRHILPCSPDPLWPPCLPGRLVRGGCVAGAWLGRVGPQRPGPEQRACGGRERGSRRVVGTRAIPRRPRHVQVASDGKTLEAELPEPWCSDVCHS
ncbi:unnamed protein product [Prorocentrum cordatum]|uniref:Uncharacterized protein n=1 Tax=Prorocentrum cordatum TaxID=2364126 RepID=A0ABN9Q7R2_9DINO|nr:unnamed protein product [Polarella glacialis]